MKTLVAIGCSHTAGAELYQGYGDHPKSKELSFAATIARHLNFEYINLAQNGASNDYIHRNAIKFVNENISNLNNYYFLIGWTSAWRFELRYRDDEDYVHNKGQHVIDAKYVPCSPNMWLGNIQESRMKKMVTKYSDILAEPSMMYDRMATYIWSLQQIFKSLNISYYMFNTVHAVPVTPSNQCVANNIDTEFFHEPFDNNVTFYNYTKDQLNFKPTKYFHMPKQAHDEYAKILLQRLPI